MAITDTPAASVSYNGVIMLDTIIRQAAVRADQPAPTDQTFITYNNWSDLVRLAQSELFDELVTTYEDYFVSTVPYVFTTTQAEFYPLPVDVHKVLGVDQIIMRGTPNSAITLKRFNWSERNRFGYPSAPVYGGFPVFRYHLTGSYPIKLWLQPNPAYGGGGQIIRVRYIPRLVPASSGANMYINGPSDGDNFTLTFVMFPTNPTPMNLIQEAIGQPSVTWTYRDHPTQDTDIQIGADDGDTAANTAAALSNIVPCTAFVPGNGPAGVTIFIAIGVPVSMTFSTPAGQLPIQFDNTRIQNYIEAMAPGWEELIILEAAIKAMIKDESNPSGLMQQKAACMHRLEAAAANRDAGSPPTTALIDDSSGYGWGGGGEGGGWM